MPRSNKFLKKKKKQKSETNFLFIKLDLYRVKFAIYTLLIAALFKFVIFSRL